MKRIALLLSLCSCVSPEAVTSKVDEKTYAILANRSEQLFGTTSEFRIDPSENSLRQQLIDGDVSELPSLNLVSCLEISAENSRDYQSNKEDLYRSALALTLEQWNYGLQFDLTASASITDTGSSSGSALSMTKLLGTGATVLGNVGSSLFRVTNGGDGWDSLSNASFSITQPLLGGSAREVIREPLTQAERNLIYEVRSFERYRRTFALEVASKYFQLIETIDNVRNEEANFEGLILLSKRNQALAEAGQLSDIEADEAQQDRLESENRLLELRGGLNKQLDNFKLYLGLPVDVEISLARSNMNELENVEVGLLELTEEDFFRTSFRKRLDYLNRIDATNDAERKVRVAEEALKIGLDLEASTAKSENSSANWSAGFSLDLPINRIPQHNAYRASLISLESARRSEQEMGDVIRARLRDEARKVRNTKQSYHIQLNAVELAQQRVESTELSLAAGRSDTRSALDARRALVSAKNAATSALVARLLARLSLLSELGLLRIGSGGFEVESEDLIKSL
ncbi:MAG: TolC family protein [Opitutales bacterium]|nr:TolC family protein [Opitutales bacterium]